MIDTATEQILIPTPSVLTPLNTNHEQAIVALAETPSGRPQEVFRSIKKEVDNYSVKIFRELRKQGVDDPDIHAFLDAVFGYLRLNEKILFQRETEKLTASEKVDSARVSQAMAHYLLYAQSPQASADIAKVMYETALLYEKISRSRFGRMSRIGSLWSGVKSQVGVMNMFINNGFEVHVPNYIVTDDVLNDSESSANEVLHWDVRAGVDLIATNRDEGRPHIFLIDAKGRSTMNNDDEPTRRFIATVENRRFRKGGELNKSLRNFFLREGLVLDREDRIPSAQIIVPTDYERRYEHFLQSAYNPRNGLVLLTRLGQQESRDILSSLRSM